MEEENLKLPMGLMIVEKYGDITEKHWCYDYRPESQTIPIRRTEVHKLDDHYIIVDDWFFGKIELLGIEHDPKKADERAYGVMTSFAFDRLFRGLNQWQDNSSSSKPHDSRPVSRMTDINEKTLEAAFEKKESHYKTSSVNIKFRTRLTLYDEDEFFTRVYDIPAWLKEGDDFVLKEDLSNEGKSIRAGIYRISEESKIMLCPSTAEDILEENLLARRVMGLASE